MEKLELTKVNKNEEKEYFGKDFQTFFVHPRFETQKCFSLKSDIRLINKRDPATDLDWLSENTVSARL